MVSEGHFAAEDINVRIMGLQQHWQSLKDKAAQRKLDLEDSLQAQQYFAGKTGLYIVLYSPPGGGGKKSKGLEKGKEKEGGKKRKKRKLGENITFGSKKS